MQITKDQVKAWHACTDGYRWFLEKFPQGGAYAAVHQALTEDKRFDDARFAVAYVGENDIKANTPYALNKNGQFVEIKE